MIGARFPRIALLCLLSGLPIAALAQAYPVKPVRVIVPLAAGGSTDNNGRLMAEKLGQALGQS